MFVLVIMSVVVMFTGAFVASNQSNFASLGATQRQREAQMACESAINFCWFKLEHDSGWGKKKFEQNNWINPQKGGMEVQELKDTHRISGKMADEIGHYREASFTVDIYNQLDVGASEEGPKVPPDSVLLHVVGESAGFRSECDVLYSGEPIYDASLTAQKRITLNGDTVISNSISINPSDEGGKVGSKNWIRSNGDIHLNSFVGNANPNKTHSLSVAKTLGDQSGVIWAKGDIYAGEKKLEGDLMSEASKTTGATFAPRSRLNHDIYKLQVQDLKLGADSQKIIMDPGSYNLELSTIKWNGGLNSAQVTTLVHTASDGSKMIYYDGRRLKGIPPEAVELQMGYKTNSVRSDEDGVVSLNSGSGPSMTFTFGDWNPDLGYTKDHIFKPSEYATVEVPGDLTITSKIEGQVPRVQLNGESGNGVLQAKGNVSIQGTLRGGGAIVSEKDIWLMATEGKSAGSGGGVNVDAQQGDVVLYGKNVNIAAGGNNKISMAGLIYAEKDVNIYGTMKLMTVGTEQVWIGDDEGESAKPLELLQLRGSVVAATGGIHVTRTKNMQITYDEKYLRAVTRGLYTNPFKPTSRRRIRQVWTRVR